MKPTNVALDDLTARIASRDPAKAHEASIDAAYASNDLQLRYRPVTEVDTMRFELWVRRVLLDVRAGSLGGVRTDVVTLEWIRDRIAHTFDPVTRVTIDTMVRDLGAAVVDEDLATAAQLARDLRDVLGTLP